MNAANTAAAAHRNTETVAARPVDLAAGVGEVELHELREGVLDGLLPWTVVIVLRCAGGHSGLLGEGSGMLFGNMTKGKLDDRPGGAESIRKRMPWAIGAVVNAQEPGSGVHPRSSRQAAAVPPRESD